MQQILSMEGIRTHPILIEKKKWYDIPWYPIGFHESHLRCFFKPFFLTMKPTVPFPERNTTRGGWRRHLEGWADFGLTMGWSLFSYQQRLGYSLPRDMYSNDKRKGMSGECSSWTSTWAQKKATFALEFRHIMEQSMQNGMRIILDSNIPDAS